MFPFEIITFLGSNMIGLLSKVWKMKIENASRIEEAKLSALNEKAQIAKEIREVDNKGFVFTRRTIALVSMVAIVVLPMLAPVLPAIIAGTTGYIIDPIPITFGYTQLDPGLWPFTSDIEITKWYNGVTGILITPWHTHLISAIFGFYFGSSR